jgi:hypothetical protein
MLVFKLGQNFFSLYFRRLFHNVKEPERSHTEDVVHVNNSQNSSLGKRGQIKHNPARQRARTKEGGGE